MEIVTQPQDELLAWDEGGDDCCVLLWNLCLQSRSQTRGPGQHGPRPSSPRARYYQKDRKEIDTSIQLPTDATHPCGIATFCRRLSSILYLLLTRFRPHGLARIRLARLTSFSNGRLNRAFTRNSP